MKKPTKAFHALNDKEIPARIHAILAREAAKAVVFALLPPPRTVLR